METLVTRTLMIGKTSVHVIDKELAQQELEYYAENPRVFTALQSSGEDIPTQATIERTMQKLDSVKKLKVSIEANGGLMTPIIVRGNVVLEGNSRLAAYRLLAAKDPIKWAMIKCTILPEDISDELVFNLLGTYHIIGQTPWSPFEQAGYLYRTKQKSRKNIKAIAKELGMKLSDAELYIKVYQTMLDANEVSSTKWSYYFELLKSRPIVKFAEQNPELRVIENIVEKIQNGEFERAEDIRKVATLAKVQTEDAQDVMVEFLNNEVDLDSAVELIDDESKVESIRKGLDKFRELIKNNDTFIRHLIRTDTDFNLGLKQLTNSLESYLKIKS